MKWTCLFGHDWWYHWSDTLREKVKVCEKCGKVDRFIHKHVAARERREDFVRKAIEADRIEGCNHLWVKGSEKCTRCGKERVYSDCDF